MLIYDIQKMKELLLFYASNPGKCLRILPNSPNWNETYILHMFEFIGIWQSEPEYMKWYKTGGNFSLTQKGLIFLNQLLKSNNLDDEVIIFYLDRLIAAWNNEFLNNFTSF